MKKKFFLLTKNFRLALIFILTTYLCSQQVTQESLNSDLNYYYKTVTEKKLSTNDKLYILNRIYEKYKNSNLDLTKLENEINLVKQELKKEQNLKVKQERGKTEPVNEKKYKISAGDVLFIRVSPAEELSKEVIVTADGKIVLPLIGSVKVEGMTLTEAEKMLEKLYTVYISNPKVNIVVKFYSKRQLFIMGEVKNPGGYPYEENIKLLELISKAGGLTQYAGKTVKIYRGEKTEQQVITVNIDEILKDVNKDVILVPGDIIEVVKGPLSVSVIGEVVYPGTYDWYENLDVLKAISMARGYTATAKLSGVKVFRETSKGKEVISVNVARILNGKMEENIILQPGDIVYVPRKPFISGQWFVNTVLPWLTLITTILLLVSYAK